MDKFYKCVLLALTALLTLAGGHRSGLAANNDANAAFAQPAGPEQAVTVRGIVKDVRYNATSDAYECWIEKDGEVHMYLFFMYDWGIVEIE